MIPPAYRTPRIVLGAVALLVSGLMSGCRSQPGSAAPAIEFTTIPIASTGGSLRTEKIEGRTVGARPGQRIVLFARSGNWWLQPNFREPFTTIQGDSRWSANTHLGSDYAALLVDADYLPPKTADALPVTGDHVLAVASVTGKKSKEIPLPGRLRFSGYEWNVHRTNNDSGGVMHRNSAFNAWTDENGWLHLRIAREGNEWTSTEISLPNSLGYGSYSFVMREVKPLEPGDVLGMFTWDDLEAGQNHREIDVEVSQWGDPASKNAQFVIQPYYVPANVFRFISPVALSAAAKVTHSFHWEAGRVAFQSTQRKAGGGDRVIAEHVFTSGVPSPGGETVHLNLYIYGKSRLPQRNDVEVIIEKFEYLP